MLENLKVAIVHDDFIQHGGAERLVLAMLEIFPPADLFSVVASKDWQKEIGERYQKKIKNSWLQKFPFRESFSPYYYSLYPLAVESFRFDGYDLVISSSARYAHGIITRPETVHVSYVNSPARFLWEGTMVPSNPLARPVISWHRAWDRIACQRPDYLIANSQTPAERIKKYWQRTVDAIIYPFVDWERFQKPVSSNLVDQDFFLIVSRLKRWKQIDLAIKACNQLNLPLWIVGEGEDADRLGNLAGPTIRFSPKVSDEELISFYQNCRALILTQVEDFGLTALEAQAAGRPVIARGQGGALETVVSGVTGVYFDEASVESLTQVLSRFDEKMYLPQNCLRQAQKFGKEPFLNSLGQFISHVLPSS